MLSLKCLTSQSSRVQCTRCHGHLDPIKRSRDALNKLLGRHSSSGAAPEAPASKPAESSSTTPAFEAPLSVPVFSRRREVGGPRCDSDAVNWPRHCGCAF
jgi:hypothetical protein